MIFDSELDRCIHRFWSRILTPICWLTGKDNFAWAQFAVWIGLILMLLPSVALLILVRLGPLGYLAGISGMMFIIGDSYILLMIIQRLKRACWTGGQSIPLNNYERAQFQSMRWHLGVMTVVFFLPWPPFGIACICLWAASHWMTDYRRPSKSVLRRFRSTITAGLKRVAMPAPRAPIPT